MAMGAVRERMYSKHSYPKPTKHSLHNDVAEIDEHAFQQAIEANAKKDFDAMDKFLDEWNDGKGIQ
jgi:hypothetical protein